jgi:hypothetical protein
MDVKKNISLIQYGLQNQEKKIIIRKSQPSFSSFSNIDLYLFISTNLAKLSHILK